MDNLKYRKKIISSMDRIIVDTSVLMSEGFRQFVSNNRALILASGKKLYVHNAVYKELARHLGSGNSYKVKCVIGAIELMVHNKDIFIVDASPLTDYEIEHAFADPELLSELTLHKASSRQLLISNDHNLSSDAFDLNLQESCKGHKVYVCYVSWNGELHCCKCALPKTEMDYAKESQSTPKPVIMRHKPIVEAPHKCSEKAEKTWEFDWKSALLGSVIGGVTTIAGYGLYKTVKAFYQSRYVLEVIR